MKLNISNLRKLEEVFLSDRSNSPRNSQYSQSYHNSESSVKCPRCENLGELIEDGPVRRLYRCEKCGIFSKLAPKRQPLAKAPEKCRLKNPCQGCHGKSGIITAVDRSTGNPHSYRLDCQDCGRFQRWVGQREFVRKMGGHNA
ncbi:MAG: hypothetical protein GPJ27_17220 [Microcystis aeruginosa L111-01]|nr:hypothetical protein [Microcystis aeruginosa L111-01]